MNISRKIVLMKIADLKPRDDNPRTHSEDQVKNIATLISEFGFTTPLLLDGKRQIIAGHGRLAAAKQLRMTEVPCIELKHLSKAQARALVIADNKIALDAGWDEEKLEINLQQLSEEGYDIELTGFSLEDVEEMREGEEHPVNAGFVALNFTVPVEARKKILKILDAIKERDGIELNGEALVVLCDEWMQYKRQEKAK